METYFFRGGGQFFPERNHIYRSEWRGGKPKQGGTMTKHFLKLKILIVIVVLLFGSFFQIQCDFFGYGDATKKVRWMAGGVFFFVGCFLVSFLKYFSRYTFHFVMIYFTLYGIIKLSIIILKLYYIIIILFLYILYNTIQWYIPVYGSYRIFFPLRGGEEEKKRRKKKKEEEKKILFFKIFPRHISMLLLCYLD